MSTDLGTSFAEKNHGKYAEVIETWASKLVGKEVTPELFAEWGADLHEALSEDLTESLTHKDVTSSYDGVKLPSDETLTRYSQIAIKYSLQYATEDLLKRLIRSADYNEANPLPEGITAAIRPMRPSELVKRSPQTTAQIFDMAKDKFTSILGNRLTKSQQFTGRRQWITSGKNSRHAALNQEIKGPDEYFTFNKEKVAAPRPVGGSPAHWSNCSCQIPYERKDGKWIIP